MPIFGSKQPNYISRDSAQKIVSGHAHVEERKPGSSTSTREIPDKVEQNRHDAVLFGNALKSEAPVLQNDNTGCFLKGTDTKAHHTEIPISELTLSKHIMLLGGIGTGKTNAFFQMISQLQRKLSANDIMIIFDTKGDFYHTFHVPGDIVISNDQTASGGDGKADYWNIFSEISDDGQQTTSVMEIAKSLFKDACEKTNQVFFPNAAKNIFFATVLHFIRYSKTTGDTQYLNNAALADYLTSRTASELREMLDSYPDLRAMTSYISEDDSPQTQGVLSELQNVVRDVFVGNFERIGSLGLRKLVKEKGGKKVFIEYDLSCGSVLAPVYSLMFDMAIKEALGRENSDGNVYLIVDEFRLLPNLEHIDDAVNFGRSLGIKCIVGIQNIDQIYDNYGQERARSILSGFSTSINFKVNDSSSRDYIKDRFGKNRKIEVYATSVQSKGMVEERRDAYVVEDWDIANLKVGQAVIGLPENEPFVFQLDLWNTGQA